jgi:hypothetical protein
MTSQQFGNCLSQATGANAMDDAHPRHTSAQCPFQILLNRWQGFINRRA